MVRQLFERAVVGAPPEQRERWLAGAAALAAPVIGAAPDVAEPVADAGFATLHGLYWLAATLADEEPLLLIVDDAHWSDTPSLRFLDFLARRAQELALLVVIGTRVNEPGAELERLEALTADATVIRPRPLSADGVRTLIGGDDGRGHQRARRHPREPAAAARAARSLGEEPATAASINAAVPSSLTRSVERRLARVPGGARRRPRAGRARAGTWTRSARRVTGPDARSALAELRGLELIEDDPPRSSTRSCAPPPPSGHRRRARPLHQAAAEHLARAGLRRTRSCTCSPPAGAPGVGSGVLREAAQRALAEGVPDAALRRLRARPGGGRRPDRPRSSSSSAAPPSRR